mmetsp:Transcript_61660/g.147124  ORF Transcript_61660/g.147124 Transcript_61660/m.147124 type:complete len:223 (+) Transcript_61660:877-1545(+)
MSLLLHLPKELPTVRWSGSILGANGHTSVWVIPTPLRPVTIISKVPQDISFIAAWSWKRWRRIEEVEDTDANFWARKVLQCLTKQLLMIRNGCHPRACEKVRSLHVLHLLDATLLHSPHYLNETRLQGMKWAAQLNSTRTHTPSRSISARRSCSSSLLQHTTDTLAACQVDRRSTIHSVLDCRVRLVTKQQLHSSKSILLRSIVQWNHPIAVTSIDLCLLLK